MKRLLTLERIADLVLIAIATIMLGLFLAARGGADPGESKPAKAPADWRKEALMGIAVGSPNAQLTIVEFMDFQCPFCAEWSARVDSLIEKHPTKVQVVFHHFPLESHPHAVAAAIASECAHRQGAFMAFQRKAFEQQKLIGAKTWSEFAAEAGVTNLKQFDDCVVLPPDSFPRIAYGLELGKRTGISGTPTVWLNGTVSRNRPTLQKLVQLTR